MTPFLIGSRLLKRFDQGTGPIHIDNVTCIGTESVLVQCSHLTINNCTHADDAGVKCSPPGMIILVKYVL